MTLKNKKISMDPFIARQLLDFTPLGLDELNSKAAMLERLDNKYIVPAVRLGPALDAFKKYFDVLEIEGERSFTYATRYYDCANRSAYYDHHQGRRKRSKVRIRHYVDAGFSYLEVKLKDKRGITIKKRLKVDCGQQRLDQRSMEFIEICHRDLYGAPFGQRLHPVIEMEYQRITLIAKEGGERMTIDTALEFETDDASRDVLPDMFIIETKSARGNGLADKILRSLHLHPTRRCSKYCVGMAALGQVLRHNRFLPALRRLHLVGPVWAQQLDKAA